MKGIIYYTSHNVDEPLFSFVQANIKQSGLPIVSCSLKPLDFGINIVIDAKPSPITMFRQILTALEALDTKIVFFCEHDVIYNSSHFSFTPLQPDIFYYNTNVWRVDPTTKKCITYDHLRSLSGLCCYRGLAIDHYKKRLRIIKEKGYDQIEGKNPAWARAMGYEPGKPKRNGGIDDDEIAEWQSEFPNLDIRHNKTLTPTKMTLESFKHKPTGWIESNLDSLTNICKKL